MDNQTAHPSLRPQTPGITAQDFAFWINNSLPSQGLFAGPNLPASNAAWRIGMEPFALPPPAVDLLQQLGPALLAFYQAVNRLYLLSRKGSVPPFVARYLDGNKPTELLHIASMGRFKSNLPLVIRPDILIGGDSWAITELDSVPGGIGLTACLAQLYASTGASLLGGPDGMLKQFAMGLEQAMHPDRPRHCAIVVSEESADYRPEMAWITNQLNQLGLPCSTCAPEDLAFCNDRVQAPSQDGQMIDIGLVYRFFELFDWENVDPLHQLLQAVKKRHVAITPPIKPQLEEKILLALFHSPGLQPWWEANLDESHRTLLQRLIPQTWVVDPAPLPPAASIHGLSIDRSPVTSFLQLKDLTQRQRNVVLKVSGFSPLSWGARGVVVGHDLSQEDWAKAVVEALDDFSNNPRILQPFFHSRKFPVTYFDFTANQVQKFSGRVRLSPYYIVHTQEAHLAGALATICPEDKKLLHGMQDAVMIPCST